MDYQKKVEAEELLRKLVKLNKDLDIPTKYRDDVQ